MDSLRNLLFRQIQFIDNTRNLLFTQFQLIDLRNPLRGQFQLIDNRRNQLSGQFELIDNRRSQLSGQFRLVDNRRNQIVAWTIPIDRQPPKSIADTVNSLLKYELSRMWLYVRTIAVVMVRPFLPAAQRTNAFTEYGHPMVPCFGVGDMQHATNQLKLRWWWWHDDPDDLMTMMTSSDHDADSSTCYLLSHYTAYLVRSTRCCGHATTHLKPRWWW